MAFLTFRSNACNVPLWPLEYDGMIPLQTLLTPVPPTMWKPIPDHPPAARDLVLGAYARAVRKHINPFITPVVVDVGCSKRFSTFGVDEFPTVTRTRARSFAYWVSTKGARVDIDELALLQGFGPSDIDWRGSGVTDTNFAGCLGNAQSMNVCLALVPHLLYFGKLITKAEFAKMTE